MRLPADDLRDIAAGVDTSGLRGKTVVITGGTGFIGRWLVETFCFLNKAHDLRARACVLGRNVDRFCASAPHLADDDAVTMMDAAELPAHFDLVIHGATAPSEELASGGPDLFFETIELSRGILEAAVRAGAQRFLYLSSGAVYGRQPAGLSHVPETFMGAPDVLDRASAYGETKRVGELLCAAYSRQSALTTVSARGFAFIGPHIPLNGKFAAGNFLKHAIEKTPIDVRGDGTPIRSYLHTADLTVWLWTMLLRGNGAYNVGSEDCVSIGQLAAETAKLADVPVTIHGRAEAGKPPDRYVPSTERARTELGLTETIDWRTALRKTFDWYRESA